MDVVGVIVCAQFILAKFSGSAATVLCIFFVFSNLYIKLWNVGIDKEDDDDVGHYCAFIVMMVMMTGKSLGSGCPYYIYIHNIPIYGSFLFLWLSFTMADYSIHY